MTPLVVVVLRVGALVGTRVIMVLVVVAAAVGVGAVVMMVIIVVAGAITVRIAARFAPGLWSKCSRPSNHW